MGWVPVVIGVLAALILYQQDRPVLLVVAVVSAIGTFWTYGMMHNYAYYAAWLRRRHRGGEQGILAEDAETAPNGLAVANFLCTLVSVGLLVFALVYPKWD